MRERAFRKKMETEELVFIDCRERGGLSGWLFKRADCYIKGALISAGVSFALEAYSVRQSNIHYNHGVELYNDYVRKRDAGDVMFRDEDDIR